MGLGLGNGGATWLEGRWEAIGWAGRDFRGRIWSLPLKLCFRGIPSTYLLQALARRSDFFLSLCLRGPERDRDGLRGPVGLGLAFEPGCLTEWPLPRHRERRVRLQAASDLVSGFGGRWGTDCAPAPSPSCPSWVGWCRCRLQ